MLLNGDFESDEDDEEETVGLQTNYSPLPPHQARQGRPGAGLEN